MNNNLENIPNHSSSSTSSPTKPLKQTTSQSQPQSNSKSSTIKLTRPSLSTLTSSISRNKSIILSPTLSNQTHTTTTSTTTTSTTSPTPIIHSNLTFSVGDRVKSTNQMIGKCAFIGTIDQKVGLWVGIDLSYPLHDPGQAPWYGKGKNSGSVNGLVFKRKSTIEFQEPNSF
ncbi:uncharacterized protein MELLADRAFT_85807 [Melampsora larici-populina 98AG31]|uniref:CAP-Gly domain-containing protein n=1 Tax=Melampsora larici-populina (strain 98AG31 / pathotype 3-4-7) TaxID=747676 RepID=F4RJU9_MELLP|nr:uncharacterized protein MELLADRAFT_85807 [Melampsora larici-populina 98AG31]EGG07434.1 hypothetical protein MELLADRAFT_85807 [Melampsora larici-populina 98AG31]